MRYILTLFCLGVIFLLLLLIYYYPLKYYEIVIQYAGSLDPLLVMSVIKVESSFRPDAVSNVGAFGLMQLMPETAEWLNKKYKLNYDYKTIEGNIALGCKYLNYLLEKDGDLNTALVHYNTGPYAEEDLKRDAGSRYLKKIFKTYGIYRVLYRR